MDLPPPPGSSPAASDPLPDAGMPAAASTAAASTPLPPAPLGSESTGSASPESTSAEGAAAGGTFPESASTDGTLLGAEPLAPMGAADLGGPQGDALAPAPGAVTPAPGQGGEPGEFAPTAAAPDAAAVAAAPIVAAPPAPTPRAKTKGVADIVFLIDVSGSMQPCLDALRRNIEVFVDSLSHGDANNAAPVKDWRGKVVGYRDIEASAGEGTRWLDDHPFVRDAVALKAQLGNLRAEGGGDEPESLLDALYTVATMEASPKGAQSEEANKWRYRSDAARVVVVFTDASFKETMSIPQARGGSLQDVANVVMANRIILSLFAPNFEGYDRLSQIDKSEWEVVEYEGLNAQEALQKYTADAGNFRTTLKQLAASVSKSAETVAL